MTDINEVHRRSTQSFALALQEASINYQRAAASNDIDGMSEAANTMAALRASMRELDLMRSEVQAQTATPTQQQQNPEGLSDEEADVARVSGLSPKEYRENRDRLRRMRADGSYRDQFSR